MAYYEIKEPIGAIIKAKDLEECKSLYLENVSNRIVFASISEISEGYAMFRLAPELALDLMEIMDSSKEVRKLFTYEVYKILTSDGVLMIDKEINKSDE